MKDYRPIENNKIELLNHEVFLSEDLVNNLPILAVGFPLENSVVSCESDKISLVPKENTTTYYIEIEGAPNFFPDLRIVPHEQWRIFPARFFCSHTRRGRWIRWQLGLLISLPTNSSAFLEYNTGKTWGLMVLHDGWVSTFPYMDWWRTNFLQELMQKLPEQKLSER